MGTIHKALKVRLYPNKKQQEILNKNLGATRALYNMMLHERIEVYEKLKNNKRELYEYKYKTEKQYKEEIPWLKEDIDSQALQQSRINLSQAYQNFFKGLSGKYRQKYNFPKFKKKKIGSSYRTMNINNNIRIDFNNRKVKLPKIGWINFRDKRTSFDGRIKSATVGRTPTGKYFVSLLFEQELYLDGVMLDTIDENQVIGLDASLDKFFVDNNGDSPAYQRIYRYYEPKLKKEQRRLSKKKKGSKNWYKQLYKVNKIHEKIKNKRHDFTHKLSTDIVNNNTVIVVEHLSLKAMSQALKLGKSVMDLGYSNFINQLQYKTIENNKIFVRADKWFASSKTCSICGYHNKELQLSDRNWTCPQCSTEHERDKNAGINLKQYGLKNIGLGQPDFKPVESKTSGSQVFENKSLDKEAGSSTIFSR